MPKEAFCCCIQCMYRFKGCHYPLFPLCSFHIWSGCVLLKKKSSRYSCARFAYASTIDITYSLGHLWEIIRGYRNVHLFLRSGCSWWGFKRTCNFKLHPQCTLCNMTFLNLRIPEPLEWLVCRIGWHFHLMFVESIQDITSHTWHHLLAMALWHACRTLATAYNLDFSFCGWLTPGSASETSNQYTGLSWDESTTKL